MPRRFNTAGPCDPADHYMVPPERRLPGLRRPLDEKAYFVVHAPRQVGKTTVFLTLARTLNQEGRYTALWVSCETAQAAGSDVELGIATLLDVLGQEAEIQLPPERRPPEVDPSLQPTTRLRELLWRWAFDSPRPLVLFLDEIDSLRDDILISVLRQLRTGYVHRPKNFPGSVALIGLRDVRDYRVALRPDDETLGSSSPFNIKVESLTLPNFTATEVAELYAQHTGDTGQPFTPEASARAFELTGGQPWLVNALARELVGTVVPDPAAPIEVGHVEKAKEILIQRRDTHLDSLVERLREARIRRVIEPILAGEILEPDVMPDDVQLVQDLGLVVSTSEGLAIANPIYREVIPRALTQVLEHSMARPRPSYVGSEGRLHFSRLLDDFVAFWREQAEAFLAQAPYSEAAAQLVFMAFLQKIVNGGGFIDREYAVGRGRIDLCVRWPFPEGLERFAVELKVWRQGRPDPLQDGLEQLARYLTRLGLDTGTLLLFDRREAATPLPERLSRQTVEHDGKRIEVFRL